MINFSIDHILELLKIYFYIGKTHIDLIGFLQIRKSSWQWHHYLIRQNSRQLLYTTLVALVCLLVQYFVIVLFFL